MKTTLDALRNAMYDTLKSAEQAEDRYGMQAERAGDRAAERGQNEAAEWYYAEMRASWARSERAKSLRLGLIGRRATVAALTECKAHVVTMQAA